VLHPLHRWIPQADGATRPPAPARWEHLGWLSDRRVFINALVEVRQIRNDIMHFDPGPPDTKPLDAFLDWLRLQGLQARGHRPQPGQPDRGRAAAPPVAASTSWYSIRPLTQRARPGGWCSTSSALSPSSRVTRLPSAPGRTSCCAASPRRPLAGPRTRNRRRKTRRSPRSTRLGW
jgi:hypothetical protein